MPLLDALTAALARSGLNLVGTTPVERYDAAVAPAVRLRALMPGAETAVVVGNGGAAFWDAFRSFCAAHPGADAVADPLDDFTRRAVETATAPALATLPHRIVYPFRFPAEPVSFQRLAEAAGLGRPSLLGVLVHPTFGPWIALRAAILLAIPLDAPRPADGFDPCPGCVERACIPACPGGAVGPAGWDVPACAAHRARPDDPCAPRCHARFDCVVGREHRYPPEALAHHQGRARPLLVGLARR